jgi:hypothetical protein
MIFKDFGSKHSFLLKNQILAQNHDFQRLWLETQFSAEKSDFGSKPRFSKTLA